MQEVIAELIWHVDNLNDGIEECLKNHEKCLEDLKRLENSRLQFTKAILYLEQKDN